MQAAWSESVSPTKPELSGNVGVRLGPFGTFNAMSDSNEAALFRHVFTTLNDHKLAYVHIIEPRVKGVETIDESADADVLHTLGRLFNGPVISAGGYRPETAGQTVRKAREASPSQEIAVAFGRSFIANPDLPLRVLLQTPLHPYDRKTFYGGTAVGYTDQPFLTEEDVKLHAAAMRDHHKEDLKVQRDIQDFSQLLTALTLS